MSDRMQEKAGKNIASGSLAEQEAEKKRLEEYRKHMASGRRRGPGRGRTGEKPRDLRGSLSRLIRYLGRYRIAVVFVMIFAAASTVFNVIGPKILGDKTGLSSFWVLFGIILFGGLWGLVGMVVAVPLVAVIYDLVKKLVFRGLHKNDCIEVWDEYIHTYGVEKPIPRPAAEETEEAAEK